MNDRRKHKRVLPVPVTVTLHQSGHRPRTQAGNFLSLLLCAPWSLEGHPRACDNQLPRCVAILRLRLRLATIASSGCPATSVMKDSSFVSCSPLSLLQSVCTAASYRKARAMDSIQLRYHHDIIRHGLI